MAKTINSKGTIPLSYNKLCSMARQIGNSMRSDFDSFAQYAITEANIQHLFDLEQLLIATDSDKTKRIDISIAANEKSAIREEISATMRSIALRAKAVFGASSAKSRALNGGNISQIRDAELESTARRIHADASAELEALSAEGLTQAYLDKFEADITAFVAATDRVKSAATEREIITEKRQAIAAELYSLLTKYCSYGKTIFAKKSPAHYKRYVLQKSKKDEKAGIVEEIARSLTQAE